MFGSNMGCHVIEFPSKRWGYVGSIPVTLGTEIPATKDDVMGCRTHRNADGDIVVWKFPTFASKAEATEFAAARGVSVK